MLAAGAVEDALGQRPDQPDVLGQRDELGGPDHAAARMAPAQQRLDAGDPAALEVALRLVVDGELVGGEGLAQLALEQAGTARHEVHLRREEAAAVAAVRLGPVHRELGVLEQPVGGLAVGREQRDADAGAGVELLAVEHERLAEAVDQAARQRARLVRAPDLGLQDRELVAAEPADRVGLAQAGVQPLGDRLEQQVAAGQTEGVVDALEAVEVEQQHRRHAVGAPRPGQRVVEAVVEQRAIGEPGQRVVAGLMAHPRLRRLELGDVERDRDHVGDPSGIVVQRRFGGQQDALLAGAAGWSPPARSSAGSRRSRTPSR